VFSSGEVDRPKQLRLDEHRMLCLFKVNGLPNLLPEQRYL
jgi:hypothetical protein